ncbi:3-oxoadipyl-CoA thiolase [Phenylobacterium sp. LjRoot225]|uniref:3-oxoadipyl-CoA thiolase n=1 Tax=Phenylobacterium sp. LjRoot225 TaxID=3342285 RepID=UPI003ECED8CE
MNPVYICDAVRTAFGRYGGALSSIRADDLGAAPIRALAERNPAIVERVDEVIFGCANQAGEDNRNVARMSLLLAGLPQTTPGVTVNRLCASGLEAIGQAARAIAAGEIELAIAGGVESMSRAPFVLPKASAPFQRTAEVYDTTIGWRFVNPAMQARYGVDTMPETAETVAEERNISREDQDAFAVRSQQRAAGAAERGFFADEIVAVQVRRGKDVEPFATDEHIRRDATRAALAGLKPIVRPGGTVTAGNASGVNDGAAAIVVASAEAVQALGLRPRARILGMASAALAPRVMGLGPVGSTQKLLARLSMKISDFATIELNEAFASQALAVLRELGLPDDAEQVNPNGGAIALGHPLGASGARLVVTGVRQLEAVGGRYGLATMCVGVGQGVSLAFERVH